MKKSGMVWLLVASALQLFGQSEKKIDSRITNVTVFLNKAQVAREAQARLEAGKTSLVLTGLTALLDPASIQVAGKGSFLILGISHRQNFLSELNLPQPLRVLRDSIDYYQRQVALDQSQKEILAKEEQMIMSNQKVGGTNQNLTVVELKAMSDFFRGRLTEIVTTRMRYDDRIRKNNERIARLQRQQAEQNDAYRKNTSEIVINVSAEQAVTAQLQISYVVNNAGWNPVYDLRATNTKSPLQLHYKANVFQGTGEDWSNVKLKLSTANPSESGQKPELYAWYLDFYQPIAYQNYRKELRSAAPTMAAGQVSVADQEEMKAETVADFVQTIQTTLSTEFDIALPYTVNSAARPTLVDIRHEQLDARYVYAVAPKLDADAFLLAKATGWEDLDLLPGEANLFFEGTFVGKSFIDPNQIKDTLSVSLGRDKRVVVKREKIKDLTSRKLIGGNQRESYAWQISVRNTKTEALTIEVEDQLPISKNTQIEVTWLDTGGAQVDANTGKLTWRFTVAPAETKVVTHKYEVKFPKDKQVSGL